MKLELRRRPTAPPEDSVAMRVVVALAVEVGVLAVVLQGAVDASAAVAALLLAPAGYLFSSIRRHRSSIVVKAMLAVALMAAFGMFLQRVGTITTVDAARVPLASLFLWVQILHAFDVPRRRDLAFSMVSSTTLVAAGGALSLTTGYLWVMLAWAALAAAWLWLSARPRPDQVVEPLAVRRIAQGRRHVLPRTRSATAAGVAAVVFASALFMAMPRLPAQLVRTPPFSLGSRTPATVSTDQVANPLLPPADATGVVDFAPDAYPGFSDAMDLRARGTLSDQIAFRVRADQPALWKAEAFDTFDGQVWTDSSSRQRPVTVGWDGQAQDVPAEPFTRSVPTRRLVQTFYIDSTQANVLFGAARIDQVYFPGAGLRADIYGSVRAPFVLDEGLVYSVVSDVTDVSPQVLASIPMAPTQGVPGLQRYLQLPSDLPARDVALARRITAGIATPYDRVLAVQSWLQAHTEYDLTVPREPAGVDAVDWFLFQTRRGFCEHIASAMAILLRAAGVPARIATGYGPGQRNPLTGYWEVRQSDAHAWVEVLIPRVGWVTFDPTFGVPPADPSWASRFMAPAFLGAIGRAVAGAVPPSVKQAGLRAWTAVAGAAGVASRAWPSVVVAGALLLLVGVGWRRRGRRRRGRPAGPTGPAGRAFEDLVATLAAAGHPREPSATPREYLDAIERDPTLSEELRAEAEVVVRTFERERYAPPTGRPAQDEVARARASASRVRTLARW
jgi:transglutaminase-like putative cysteine protease